MFLLSVETCLRIFHTPGPSLPIAASLDYARSVGIIRKTVVRQLIARIEAFVRNPACFHALNDERTYDPTRIVLDFSASGLERHTVLDVLDEHAIDVEFCDLCRLVLIPALDQPPLILTTLGALKVLAVKAPRRIVRSNRRCMLNLIMPGDSV